MKVAERPVRPPSPATRAGTHERPAPTNEGDDAMTVGSIGYVGHFDGRLNSALGVPPNLEADAAQRDDGSRA